MSNTHIEFHKGLRGSGVVVSVTYNNSRVIFDFGAPYEPQNQVYDNDIRRRVKNKIKDGIILGNVPPIDGIFDEDHVKGIDIKSYQQASRTTGVIISHLHLDHMSNIDMVHPNIPVYMHKDGYNLLQALIDIEDEVHSRDYTPVELHTPFTIGEIMITAYFSDHPCFGACGYLIETGDKTIYYSGDIRFHGLRSEKAYNELELFADKNIDLLIIDGTTYSKKEFIRNTDSELAMNIPTKALPEQAICEKFIYNELTSKLKQSDTLGIFNIYHRDMQLIEALIECADKSNRIITFEPKTAYVIKKLLNRTVNVYDIDVTIDLPYIKEIENNPRITDEDISKCPTNYLLQNSYENLLELLSLPTTNANYFHLFGLPLIPTEPNYKIMKSLVNRMNINFHSYTNLYSFNHAYPGNLCYMIERIAAKMVVAVHSRNPEKLVTQSGVHILPKENVLYQIEKDSFTEIERKISND